MPVWFGLWNLCVTFGVFWVCLVLHSIRCSLKACHHGQPSLLLDSIPAEQRQAAQFASHSGITGRCPRALLLVTLRALLHICNGYLPLPDRRTAAHQCNSSSHNVIRGHVTTGVCSGSQATGVRALDLQHAGCTGKKRPWSPVT